MENTLEETLSNMLTEAAPAASEAALTAMQVYGGIGIVAGIVGLVMTGAAIRFCWKALRKCTKDDDGEVFWVAGMFITLMFFVGALVTTLDPWNWIAVFSPEVAIAKNVIVGN